MSTLLLALVTAVSTSSAAADSPMWLEEEVARVRVPWTEPSGEGIGLAYDNGSWGGQWMQGIRVNVPLHDHFGVLARGLVLFGSDPGFGDRIDMGTRIEFYGRSPVFLNLFRLYGGGGVSVMSPVHGVPNPEVAVGGGGHFGFEFFQMPFMSWILEVGGNSASQGGFGSGATIIAGIQFYPF